LERLARQALERAPNSELLWLVAPAPRVPLGQLFGAASHWEDAFVWQPPDEGGALGFGVARSLESDEPARFEDLRKQAGAMFALCGVAAASGLSSREPRCFGGFSFLAPVAGPAPAGGSALGSAPAGGAPAVGSLWQGWPAARFVLPSALYQHTGPAKAELAIVCDLRGTSLRTALLSATEARRRVLEALESASGAGATGDFKPKAPLDLELEEARVVSSASSSSPSEFALLVAKIQAGIGREAFEKVVAARRTSLTLEAPPGWPAVLERLGRDESCTQFAVSRAGAVFLGATPERLVRKLGRRVETEAVAGSVRAGVENAEELLASHKERAEHAIVVREIERALSAYAHKLDVQREPALRQLSYVTHLHTPITAELDTSVHVLELVETLHPTPAVGGVPKASALDFIREDEHCERGWYAAPVGWFDRAGDGSFAVALRSALLHGNVAHLYAGAGVVRASNPESEYGETELKLRSVLRALGVAP
jgi:menaquinone-specific isochorismate synthase